MFSGHFYRKAFEHFILNNNCVGVLKSQRRTTGFITRQWRFLHLKRILSTHVTVTREFVSRNFCLFHAQPMSFFTCVIYSLRFFISLHQLVRSCDSFVELTARYKDGPVGILRSFQLRKWQLLWLKLTYWGYACGSVFFKQSTAVRNVIILFFTRSFKTYLILCFIFQNRDLPSQVFMMHILCKLWPTRVTWAHVSR